MVVRRAYEHHVMKTELEQMRQAMRAARERRVAGSWSGSSGRAQVVYDLIRRVTDVNAYVMITGESGTGKELVARAIHSSEQPRECTRSWRCPAARFQRR